MLDRRNLVYRQGWEISLFDIIEKNYSNDSRIIIWDMLDRDNYFEESRNFCYPVWLWIGIFFFPFIVSKRTLEVKMIDFAGYIWEISFHSRKFTRGINFIKINLAGRGNGYREYQFWDISSIRGWGKSFWEMLECFIYERVKGESMS